MVSVDWLDWKLFTMHRVESRFAPSLQLPTGERVNYLGYITGTWTEDGQLSRQHSALQFFVMDCRFKQMGSDECYDFVINSAMLAEDNLHRSQPVSLQMTVAREILTLISEWAREKIFLR